jgi:glucose/arabinose dehydrogenase
VRYLWSWLEYGLKLGCLFLLLALLPLASVHARDSDSRAQAVPGGFTQDVLASGLSYPTALVNLPDGRILIAEKAGVVKLYKNGVVLGTPVIDIQDRVNDFHDRGMLGLTIDPDFARNGFIYLLYTYENDEADYGGPKTGRLARYTVVGDTASPSTEAVLLGTTVGRSCNDFPAGTDCIPSDSPSHSVGNVKFAPDGSLFVTLGDGADFTRVHRDALRAQDLDSLGGKVIRITPGGQGLPTNPFWNGAASANRSKVWSLGLRNPYRFNLRPGSAIPYLGDVGWNTHEEINVATAGANLGWPCYEGFERQGGYAPQPECQALYALGESAVKMPLYSWPHAGGTAAATGGVFYTGTVYPDTYQGVFFFGDFPQGWMRYLRVDAQDNLLEVSDFANDLGGMVAVELGPDTHLYYLSIIHGELRRIRYTGGNSPPTAVASATPTNGSAPLSVRFSSSGSGDVEGDPLSYSWDFGDGSPTTSEPSPLHTYSVKGTYTARLTVTDSRGGSSSAVVVISVGNHAPTATIHQPHPSLLFKVGDEISFSGSATDPEDGTIPDTRLAWTVVLHHCPGGECHPHPYLSRTGQVGGFTVPDHGDEFFFELRLTATDANGLSDTKSVTIHPQTVRFTLDTSPPGLLVVYDGVTSTAPVTRTAVVGATHTLYAPSPQGDLHFESWSDGGDIQHPVTVGTTDATYVATFAPSGPIVCPVGEFRAEYFANRELAGPPLRIRCEPAPINYDWGLGAPFGTGVGPDDFSVRWTGRFYFPSGFYRFTVHADDGVRLWVGGGAPLVDAWVDQAPTSYYGYRYLFRGYYDVRLEYYEAGVTAVSELRWLRLR